VLPGKPAVVLSAGFAGALAPSLRVGEVLFDADEPSGLAPVLAQAGATRGTFHCAERVAATAAAKRALRAATGADAVEMESGVLRALCRDHGIPSATVRVISDAAEDDLPLDFNDLMTERWRLNYWRLTAQLLRRPAALGRLLRFRRQLARAAEDLAAVLLNVLAARSRSAA
jgi:nucleoside phosphorylase